MTIKHFVNEVAHALQEHLGEHYIVDATTTIKNNSIELSGVRIRHEEDTIFPTIYLNDSFELYMNNRISLSEIVIQAAESYQQSRKSIETLNPLDSTVFENCRDRVSPYIAGTKPGNAGKNPLHSVYGPCYYIPCDRIHNPSLSSFVKNNK